MIVNIKNLIIIMKQCIPECIKREGSEVKGQ